jgi:putative hydrolase of the HAD superfamily
MSGVRAVTWDFGQTLAELDCEMLARRLAERSVTADAVAIARRIPAAWSAYDAAIKRGVSGHPWKLLMREMLAGGGVEASAIEGAVDWLWDEQPKQNLWRQPIEGMIDIVDELREKGLKIGVISNSEGKLAELCEEMRWSDRFAVVADSGKLEIQKPDPRIFLHAAEKLGVAPAEIVHVGDSFAADVEGALAVGMRAIWYRRSTDSDAVVPAGVLVATDAASTRVALAQLGVPIATASARR